MYNLDHLDCEAAPRLSIIANLMLISKFSQGLVLIMFVQCTIRFALSQPPMQTLWSSILSIHHSKLANGKSACEASGSLPAPRSGHTTVIESFAHLLTKICHYWYEK